MALYLGERWEVSYGIEAAFGTPPTAALTATNLFGVFDDCTLPDLEFEHQPYWLMNSTNRTYNIAYRGRARSEGSIPNIVLLDGRPLFLPLADTITHVGVGAPYTHTFQNTSGLKSIRLVATQYPETGTTAGLCRWFVGGKVNRATYHCEEGGMLTMSLDDIIFKMPYYEDDDATNIAPWYDVDSDKQTLSWPTTEPYYFSQASIKMKLASNSFVEATIPSIRNFRLDVNNNLEPKYYLATNDEKVPYEIREGRKEYRMAFLVDLVDYTTGSFDKNDFFIELLNQGINTTLKGCAVEVTFTRGAGDSIRFRTPIDYTPAAGLGEQGNLIIRAPHNIATENVLAVPVEMLCRDLEVVVTDSIAGGSYPI